MRKFIGVSVTVILGIGGLISLITALTSAPELLGFFSGCISWLHDSLGYQEEILVGVGALVAASWSFDMEIGRDKGPRKLAAASTFLCVTAAIVVLLSSIDHLDGDPLLRIGISGNQAVAASPKGSGTARNGPLGNGAKATPAAEKSNGPLASASSSESGFEPGASDSKDESGSSAGCTCPPPVKVEPPLRSGGGGEVVRPEEARQGNEAAEEAEEAAEEAEEEREEAEEEAELESEFGL